MRRETLFSATRYGLYESYPRQQVMLCLWLPSKQHLECSTERPAFFTMPPIVNALTGLIMARDGYETFPITHDDVFALSDYPKTSFFKRAYRVKMVDSGQLRHNYAITSIS